MSKTKPPIGLDPYRSSQVSTEAVANQSKKLLTGVILRGDFDSQFSNELKSKIKPSATASIESLQLDNQAKRDAMLSLFVIKPKQTGFSSSAELLASAIKNPSGTAVYAVRGESGDRDVELNLDKLLETLDSSGVHVAGDTDQLADYINQAKTDADEFTWIEAEQKDS